MSAEFESDDELMERLAGVLGRVDPVPTSVIAAARASATWRTIDTELAALMYDSVMDRNEWIGVRGGGTRLLTFTSPDLTIELELLAGGRGLIGQVGGVSPGQVEICYSDGATAVETDEIGHFSCPTVRPGPMSIRVVDDTGSTVTQTEWVVI